MGRKCCVTGCNGNYDKQNEESTSDPPSEFFCVKSSLVPTLPPFQEQQQKPCHQSETKKDDELSAFMEKDKIRSLDEICQNINNLENTTMKVVCFQTLKRADNTVK